MKKYLALSLALAMLALCGCSGVGANALTEETVKGVWSSEDIEGTDILTSAIEADADEDVRELLSYMEMKPFSLALKLEFSGDGSFLMSADEERMQASVDALYASLKDGFHAYLQALLEESLAQQGLTLAEFRATNGLSETDDIFAFMGIDIDALLAGVDLDATVDSVSRAMLVQGNYELKNGGLTLLAEGGAEAATYDAAADTLTLAGDGEEDEALRSLYPMVFHRVG